MLGKLLLAFGFVGLAVAFSVFPSVSVSPSPIATVPVVCSKAVGCVTPTPSPSPIPTPVGSYSEPRSEKWISDWYWADWFAWQKHVYNGVPYLPVSACVFNDKIKC